MDGRDAFLTMARDRHYEFSSLRRCKYSTLALLYELHTQVMVRFFTHSIWTHGLKYISQGQDKFVYNCNTCAKSVETRYHCTVCEDFDLCVACYQNDGHPHKMEKLGFDLDGGGGEAVPTSNPQEARKLSIQRCIQSLVHACQCRDANCRLPSCHKMKRVVSHTKQCKRKTNGGCPICKQLIALCCYHAKLCQVREFFALLLTQTVVAPSVEMTLRCSPTPTLTWPDTSHDVPALAWPSPQLIGWGLASLASDWSVTL